MGLHRPPAVVYIYAPGRGAQHAIRLLDGYSGIVQCDGYAPYKQLVGRQRSAGNSVTLAFCWSHWRRRFYDIAKRGPAPIADEALRRIAALYAIEDKLRGQSAEVRQAVRQAQSKPLVEALKTWLEAELARVSAKSTNAANWACLASLVETCKLNGVDPQAYLTDVLTKLVNLWPAARLDELLPWEWAKRQILTREAA